MRTRIRRPVVRLDALEDRRVPADLTIPLDPDFDQFGDQVISVQGFDDAARSTFGIFDTGSSAVTFSPDDQAGFTELGTPIPIKVPGGAVAGGIGGEITGDVSEPGTILADGMHVGDLTFDADGFPVFNAQFTADSAATPGIQTFVGTEDGSPDLPTITGTPELLPSPGHPSGLAAQVDMQGYLLDFSDVIPGLTLAMPDLHFVEPGTAPVPTADTTAPIYVPLGRFGADNSADPGDLITETYSPTQDDVTLGLGSVADRHLNFLFDTGAQLTVISTQVAEDLGLDLAHPETTIDVQGVAGTETVPGYTIDRLDLPQTDGSVLSFTHVPVYVLDVDPALDGILGMNLWNTAATVMIDPNYPGGGRLGLTFYTNPDRGDPGGIDPGLEGYLQMLGGAFGGAVDGHNVPNYDPQTKGGSVGGEVFQDTNGNGTHDGNEPGLAGRTVYLDKNRNGLLDAREPRMTTDASGDWWFDGLAAGTYVVRQVLPAGWMRTAPATNAITVRLAAHQDAVAYRFGDFQRMNVVGTVFSDRDRDGVRDPDEPDLRGVVVYLDMNNNGRHDPGEPYRLTDATGAYHFNHLRPGTYHVREVVPRGWEQTAPAGHVYTIDPVSGLSVSDDDFGNFRAGR